MFRGALQPIVTRAEDRATQRCDLSAVPGAESEVRAAVQHAAVRPSSLRNRHQCAKPSRHDAATLLAGSPSPLANASRSKFQFTVNQDKVQMDNWLRDVFYSELRNQITFAELALSEIRLIPQTIKTDGERIRHSAMNDPNFSFGSRPMLPFLRLMDQFWLAVQSMLAALANISKLLFPPDSKQRGIELRQSLGIPDDSFFNSRRMRNNYEHFDERIDTWAKTRKAKHLVDRTIGDHASLQQEFGIDNCLRNYDPDRGILTFCGETFEIALVEPALHDLKLKLAAPRKGHGTCSSALQ